MTAALFALLYTFLNGIADALPVLLAALLHEAGHLLFCRFMGVPVRRFLPAPFGAVIGYDASLLSYGREAAVAAAGPFTNLLSAAAVLPLRGRFAALFGMASLGLAFFNLLPMEHLDGGVILRALLSVRLEVNRADRVVQFFSRCASVFLFLLAATAQLRCGGNVSLLLLSVYFLFVT